MAAKEHDADVLVDEVGKATRTGSDRLVLEGKVLDGGGGDLEEDDMAKALDLTLNQSSRLLDFVQAMTNYQCVSLLKFLRIATMADFALAAPSIGNANRSGARDAVDSISALTNLCLINGSTPVGNNATILLCAQSRNSRLSVQAILAAYVPPYTPPMNSTTIPTLGEASFESPLSRVVSDDIRIPERIEAGAEPGLEFELAGPRAKLFFSPGQTRAGIVTCGGLCPGLNNVIRSIFLELHFGYGIAEVLGFRGGYTGLDPSRSAPPIKLTLDYVRSIHQRGGTVLGSSRGPVDTGIAVDNLIRLGVNILFTIGGDGTQRGAHDLYQEARRRGHALSVVGVPKTIDNDVGFVSRTFGYLTAVEEAVRVLDSAHTEACSVPGGIGLVKLMGRHAGFITVGATVASQDVNFALVPEVPFSLVKFLAALKRRMQRCSHAVIAVAEGAGQELLNASTEERDASGNVKLKDVGTFLRDHIKAFFKAEGMPVVVRYFDPSYQVRSRPANCEDAILCDLFARNAVHAAMAGKTGLVIGFLHERFIHIPIEMLAGHTKRLDPAGGWWRAALATTGQPASFA